MPLIAAIALRCLLVFGLVIDGVPAFAIDMAPSAHVPTSDAGMPDPSPCHGDGDSDRRPTPDEAPDCCGPQCDCSCVTNPVLVALASIPAADGPTGMAAPGLVNLFAVQSSPRLLRPPI